MSVLRYRYYLEYLRSTPFKRGVLRVLTRFTLSPYPTRRSSGLLWLCSHLDEHRLSPLAPRARHGPRGAAPGVGRDRQTTLMEKTSNNDPFTKFARAYQQTKIPFY